MVQGHAVDVVGAVADTGDVVEALGNLLQGGKQGLLLGLRWLYR